MRFIALDVHRDFCEVAIKDESGPRLAGRAKPSHRELGLARGGLRVRAAHAHPPQAARAGAQGQGRRSWPSGHALSTKQDRAREAEFAEQVETAYRRLVADWQPRAPRSGAGATRAPIFKSSSWRRDSSAAAISPRTCAFQSAKIEPTRSRFPDMARPVSSRAVVGPSWQPRSLLGLVRCHAAALACG